MDQASRQASNCSVFLPACVVKRKQVVCKHAHTTHTERHIGYDDFSSTGDCCFAAPVCLSEASRTSLIILPAQLPWTLTDMIGCWDAERESPGLSLEPPKKARGGVLAVSVDRLSRIVQCNSIMHLFCWIVCMSLSVSLSLSIFILLATYQFLPVDQLFCRPQFILSRLASLSLCLPRSHLEHTCIATSLCLPISITTHRARDCNSAKRMAGM